MFVLISLVESLKDRLYDKEEKLQLTKEKSY